MHGHYHGNFYGGSVFLSSSKDAYIGYFSYDKKDDDKYTTFPPPVYTRAPELWPSDNFIDGIVDIRKEQLGDIYSFGVVMHSILTETAPEKRFGNMYRSNRVQILKGNNYSEFLFSGDNNEIFENENFRKAKEIIEKCMNYCYQNMNEVIDDIRSIPLFIENKKEIDFRLETATSKDYNCTFSDVIESYYRGSNEAKQVVEKVLKDIQYGFEISSDEEIIKVIFDILNKNE